MTPSTYSIVACDLDRREWGVAVQSKFLAVGSLVPSAEPEVGAIASQAWMNVDFGPDGLGHLRRGLTAEETLALLVSSDEQRGRRQVGVVDTNGRSASYTGTDCLDWAGSRTGACYAVQGNILVSEATVDAMAATFEASRGAELAGRLLGALAAGQAAGGDRQPRARPRCLGRFRQPRGTRARRRRNRPGRARRASAASGGMKRRYARGGWR